MSDAKLRAEQKSQGKHDAIDEPRHRLERQRALERLAGELAETKGIKVEQAQALLETADAKVLQEQASGLPQNPTIGPALRIKNDRREDEFDLAMNKTSKPRETASKRTPKHSVPETPMATLLSTRVAAAGGCSLS